MITGYRFSLFLFGMTCLTSVTVAQERNARWTATRLEEVDEDFDYQGEYTGFAALGASGCWQQAGIQIVAQGDQAFLLVIYPGGLPGAGWNRQPVERHEVLRSGHRIRIPSGEVLNFQRGWVLVESAAGLYQGRLNKVQRCSPTLGLRPPRGAVVLFDGSTTEALQNPKVTPDGLLEVGTQTTDAYGDFRMHVEFRLPYMPLARGQGRSNSGVYLQSRYEVQILDSFGLEGIENECGALYRYRRPELNMCLPPLTWQTYDIEFRAARFDSDGRKIKNARLTVYHNGVAVHRDFEVEHKTGAGAKEGPNPLPTKFQNHSNPVVFRNLWVLPLEAQANLATNVSCRPCCR